MNILESVRLALRALAANKLRSVLTMLGIIIGVGAVITLMAAGEGVSVYIEESFQGIGSNLLFVLPGSQEQTMSGPPGRVSGGGELTNSDVEVLRDPVRAPDVAAVSPEIFRSAIVATGQRDMMTQVTGATPDFIRVRNWVPEIGSFINQVDMNSRARVALVGKTVVRDLFPDNPYPLEQMIRINNVPFRIIGVLEEKGGSQFNDQDNTVVIPLTTAQARLFSSRSSSGEYTVSAIMIQAASSDRMDAAAEQIALILRERRGIDFRDEDNFSIISQSDIISVFGQITGVLTIFLGAIAGISLLVGGIGIMNIMLVSVTERTREIGLRKAVGARRRDILLQFLLEAVTLSLVGGVIGIGLGALGAEVISSLVEGFRSVLTPQSVVLATTFSAAVGLFFGIYPARRAALLNPIDALRYE
ncbi:MAG TPA: FtsX-like permease family protein [Chloroflexi bacterium]|nr:FtsX-like permease family protein [Chloroflexota bacterium]